MRNQQKIRFLDAVRLALRYSYPQLRLVEYLFVENLADRLNREREGSPSCNVDLWLSDVMKVDLDIDHGRLIEIALELLEPLVRDLDGHAAAGAVRDRGLQLMSGLGAEPAGADDDSDRVFRHAFQTAAILLAEAESEHPGLGAQLRAVSATGETLSRAMGLPEPIVTTVKLAGLVYELGKLQVDPHALACDGPLTTEQWALMRRHVEFGEAIVARHPVFVRLGLPAIVRSHHERFDGYGYPDQRSAQAILLESRILSVVDAYHAMITPRSYRPAFTPQEAIARLGEGRNLQWDGVVIDRMIALLRKDARGEHRVSLRSVTA